MKNISSQDFELRSLCFAVRTFLYKHDYRKCVSLISSAMGKYSHAPQPHNLFGIILEREGRHVEAMKHFCAAWSLDPTYQPARHNLEHYGGFS